MTDPHNPHYDDPVVFYDAGLFYADGVPDNVPSKPKTRSSGTRQCLQQRLAAMHNKGH